VRLEQRPRANIRYVEKARETLIATGCVSQGYLRMIYFLRGNEREGVWLCWWPLRLDQNGEEKSWRMLKLYAPI